MHRLRYSQLAIAYYFAGFGQATSTAGDGLPASIVLGWNFFKYPVDFTDFMC